MSNRERCWRPLVAALESSGLSRAEFCRRRRLNYHTMTYWVKRLAGSGEAFDGRPRASFVEVSLPSVTAASEPAMSASSPPMPASDQAMASDRAMASDQAIASDRAMASDQAIAPDPAMPASVTYEVAVAGGRSIRLGATFDEEVVARLVRTLESC